MSGLLLVWLLATIILACVPAEIARRKGRSALGFWLFGLLFFFPALIVALIIQPDRVELGERALAETADVGRPPPGPADWVPIAGLFVAVWASLPKWSGPKLNVLASTEVVDHVVPAILVLLCSLVAIAAGRRAGGPGGTRFLAGMGVLLAGLWMMATHLPLVAEANRGDAPWPATIYHTSAALAVFGLGLLWATVTWSEAGDADKKPAAQAEK